MTGKEFRKGLKKLFKENGIDDLNVSVVGVLSFLTLYSENDDGTLGDTVYHFYGGRNGDNPDEFEMEKRRRRKF